MSATDELRPDQAITFGGLAVPVSPDVLTPRPWTLMQSQWAAALLEALPPGPIVECFAGAGQIGLEVARRSGRRVILIDVSPNACAQAAETAERNGLTAQVEIRCESVEEALGSVGRPAIVLADPPYVPTSQVEQFPQDPVLAIDGGDDGLFAVRQLLNASASCVADVPMLLQLRGSRQAASIGRWLKRSALPIQMVQVRALTLDRAVVLLDSCRPRRAHRA